MQISMYKERWQPHIKDYEGATVMECYINPNIDYLDILAMISRQRKAVQDKVYVLRIFPVICLLYMYASCFICMLPVICIPFPILGRIKNSGMIRQHVSITTLVLSLSPSRARARARAVVVGLI